jgi:hypothetical protein
VAPLSIPGLLLAACAVQAQQPAMTDESLYRLVSLPADEAFSSTGSFKNLRGFEDTDHLAPLLLPTESRFRTLQTKEQVREALSLDPLLAELNAALSKAAAAELNLAPAGAAALEAFSDGLPPILFSESKDTVGTYRPALDALAVNWKDARLLFPEAKKLDCAGLERFLAASPSRAERFARAFGPVLVHELTHARQRRLFSLEQFPAPSEMEQEAYYDEVRFIVERLEGGAGLLSVRGPLQAVYFEELVVFQPGFDKFLDIISSQYAGARGIPPIKELVSRQRRAIESASGRPAKDRGRALLARLESVQDYYGRWKKAAAAGWPPLSIRAAKQIARARLDSNPIECFVVLSRASALAREQRIRDPELEPLFEKATAGWLSRLEKTEGFDGRMRERFAKTVASACGMAGFDCAPLLSRLEKN